MSKGTVTHQGKESSQAVGSGITNDAWGRQKVTNDFSLYHGMFTYTVPAEYWKEEIGGVEQASFTNATSVDGELALTSSAVATTDVILQTFRNPRYQPNRGVLYSVSLFLPNPTNDGVRDFGLFNAESGVFFRMKSDGNLYAVRRTTISSVTTDTEEQITELPPGFDAEKGNIYDIQCQWRGVGNFLFYIGNPETGASYLVKKMDMLGKLDNLSTYNPALPLAFRCKNTTQEVKIRAGCVDLTSEGGKQDLGFYGSISISNQVGQVGISGFNVPVVVAKSLKTFPGGLINTRDIVSLFASAYSDQRSLFRVWATRDETAITLNDQSWQTFRDGNIEYLEYNNPTVATPMTFDTTKAQLIFTSRIDQDMNYTTTAIFNGLAEIAQTPGDIFIFTMHRETGTAANVGVTYEFAEQI